MRKHFYLSPRKEVDVTMTFLLQGTTPEGSNEKIFKCIETTMIRKDMIEQARLYAESSSYSTPLFVVHDYLADCHALLVNIKNPQGEIIWKNHKQEV